MRHDDEALINNVVSLRAPGVKHNLNEFLGRIHDSEWLGQVRDDVFGGKLTAKSERNSLD